jgi:hypothetical protein
LMWHLLGFAPDVDAALRQALAELWNPYVERRPSRPSSCCLTILDSLAEVAGRRARHRRAPRRGVRPARQSASPRFFGRPSTDSAARYSKRSTWRVSRGIRLRCARGGARSPVATEPH